MSESSVERGGIAKSVKLYKELGGILAGPVTNVRALSPLPALSSVARPCWHRACALLCCWPVPLCQQQHRKENMKTEEAAGGPVCWGLPWSLPATIGCHGDSSGPSPTGPHKPPVHASSLEIRTWLPLVAAQSFKPLPFGSSALGMVPVTACQLLVNQFNSLQHSALTSPCLEQNIHWIFFLSCNEYKWK